MEFTVERFKNIERINFAADDINLLVGGNNPAHLSSSCGIDVETATDILTTAFETRKAELISKYVNTVTSVRLKIKQNHLVTG